MDNRQKFKEINGKKYTLITMGTIKSLQTIQRITKASGLDKNDLTDAEQDVTGFVLKLLANDNTIPIIQDLLKDMTCNDRSFDFDTHFATYKEDLIPCIAFSVVESLLPLVNPASLSLMAEMIAGAFSQE